MAKTLKLKFRQGEVNKERFNVETPKFILPCIVLQLKF